jgi:hypothetical protein
MKAEIARLIPNISSGLSLGALLCGSIGCAGMFTPSPDRYAQTGVRQPAKQPTCEYQLISTIPQQPYDELGIIDAYKSQTRETSEFINGIRGLVCAAGGDAAIAEKAGNGFYFKATVIKFKGQ